MSSLIPSSGGIGVLADIERGLSQQPSNIKKSSTRRIDEPNEYVQLEVDSSNRSTVP